MLPDLLNAGDASGSEGFDFNSDNAAGVDPRILDALGACNSGFVPPYGMERFSKHVDSAFAEVFERECFVFSVPTGTAANGLALGGLAPSYGEIFLHEAAHAVTTECGAPEFFTNGARLVLLGGENNKIELSAMGLALSARSERNVHQLLPSVVSLTQATELGAVYSVEELATISDMAHAAGVRVHMDGARFANAMVSLSATPAEMSWKAGIDVVSFGATKNGTMNVDAVVVFDQALAEKIRYLHKRAGFLSSKMRFMSVQLLAYLEKDLWIRNAEQANRNAARLADAIGEVDGASLLAPVAANELFAHLPEKFQHKLESAGIQLRSWPHPRGDLFRLVASYCDSEALLATFEAVCRDSQREDNRNE